MGDEIKEKVRDLIMQKRVMTLAVSQNNIPWSAPVYFVWRKNAFFFFSNEFSRHIQNSNKKTTAGSIFHDSDQMNDIYGLQMTGTIKRCASPVEYISVVKSYVRKFEFLKKAFGSDILSKNFFQKKFNSFLYGLYPESIFLSDNSKGSDKQIPLDMNQLKNIVN